MEDNSIWSEVGSSMPEEPQKKKKRMKLWKKILITFISVIVALAAVLFISFIFLRISGKRSIYKNVAGKKPSFDNESESGNGIKEVHVDPDSMEEIVIVGVDSENPGDGNNNQTTAIIRPQAPKPGEEAGYDIMYGGEKYVYNKDIITLLFLGIDNSGKVKKAKDGISGGQSDTIMLLVLNPHTKVMDIIAIPRDTIAIVDIYDRSGAYVQSGYTQICLQHGYGDGMSLSNKRATQAISKLFYDLPIHACTSINKGGIASLNDSIGGVTVKSLHTFETSKNKFVEGQSVKLVGSMAFDYLTERDCSRHFTASERLARQKQYLTCCMDQVIAAVKKDVRKIVDIYNAVKDYVVTDLSIDEMTYLASEAVNYKFGQIYTLQGSTDTSRKYERYYLDENAFNKLIVDMFYEKIK